MRMPWRQAPVRTGGRPVVVTYPDRPLVVRERIFVPLWVTVLQSTLLGLWRVLVAVVRFAIRHPVASSIAGVLAWTWHLGGLLADVALVVVVAAACGAWWWRWPVSFERRIAVPVRSWWRFQWIYRPRWRRLMAGCGLLDAHDHAEVMPQIARLRSYRDGDALAVTLAPGQIPADVIESAEALAHGLGAVQVVAVPAAPGVVDVTVIWRDALEDSFAPELPADDVPTADRGDSSDALGTGVRLVSLLGGRRITGERVLRRLGAVKVGIVETGGAWVLSLLPGRHLLVAGSTGSGKSGLLWAILWELRDLISGGWITVTALDPKYVELRALRTSGLGTVVTDVASMPDVLDGLVDELNERCEQMTGRSHLPSKTSPVRIVVVDELATLTALSDTKSKARVEKALGHLLSRGRAAGYLIILTTVEPTKEVVRWRGLCANRVCYRTDDDGQADLALGDGAHDLGAHTELISEDTPGIAYARVEGRAGITRVRTEHVTDDHLDALGGADLTTEPGAGDNNKEGAA